MDIVSDACSIILLAKSTLLEEFAKWKNIVITDTVYKEVLEGKDKKLFDALLLERLVEEGKIHVGKKFKKEIAQKLINDFGLGIGEAETISLTLDTKNKIILTDNKQGRKAAKVQGLNLIGSIEVIVSLHKNKKISKEKAISSLNILKNVGWFQDYLLEKAIEEVKKKEDF